MKKLAEKKLALSIETIRSLAREKLGRAAGGGLSLSEVLQSCDKGARSSSTSDDRALWTAGA